MIHGVPITYSFRRPGDRGLVRAHIRRELTSYALLKDAIGGAAKQAQLATAVGQAPQPVVVLDVGANHGLFALFAATLGARVVAVEPQKDLCAVILAAAQMNGPEVAKRITLYQYPLCCTTLDGLARHTICDNNADVMLIDCVADTTQLLWTVER
jgi:hypothetical protein